MNTTADLAARLAASRQQLLAARAIVLTAIDAVAPEYDHHGDALMHVAQMIEEAADDVGGVASVIVPEAP